MEPLTEEAPGVLEDPTFYRMIDSENGNKER